MYFNNLVRTKRLEYMLTFLVGIICFFLIAIFSSILIAWKMTLTNILMFNKKINIIFKFLSIRSRRRKRILTKNRSRRAPLLVVRIVHQFRNFTQNISTSCLLFSYGLMMNNSSYLEVILTVPLHFKCISIFTLLIVVSTEFAFIMVLSNIFIEGQYFAQYLITSTYFCPSHFLHYQKYSIFPVRFYF